MATTSVRRLAAVGLLALLALLAAVHAAAASPSSTRLEYEDFLIQEAASDSTSGSSASARQARIASTGIPSPKARTAGKASEFTSLLMREVSDEHCSITQCAKTCNSPNVYIE
jgi:hypothetical protein